MSTTVKEGLAGFVEDLIDNPLVCPDCGMEERSRLFTELNGKPTVMVMFKCGGNVTMDRGLTNTEMQKILNEAYEKSKSQPIPDSTW